MKTTAYLLAMVAACLARKNEVDLSYRPKVIILLVWPLGFNMLGFSGARGQPTPAILSQPPFVVLLVQHQGHKFLQHHPQPAHPHLGESYCFNASTLYTMWHMVYRLVTCLRALCVISIYRVFLFLPCLTVSSV